MARAGWSNLIPRENWLDGSTAFRIDAYSEYMPPPRVGWKPYGPVPAVPEVAPFLPLSGHVRVASDPRSTLFNTDGQIFSDEGVPCVLLMENYDINRTGYHDTHDTMENIDLDYGAAVCAITIEAVARAASSTDSPL